MPIARCNCGTPVTSTVNFIRAEPAFETVLTAMTLSLLLRQHLGDVSQQPLTVLCLDDDLHRIDRRTPAVGPVPSRRSPRARMAAREVLEIVAVDAVDRDPLPRVTKPSIASGGRTAASAERGHELAHAHDQHLVGRTAAARPRVAGGNCRLGRRHQCASQRCLRAPRADFATPAARNIASALLKPGVASSSMLSWVRPSRCIFANDGIAAARKQLGLFLRAEVMLDLLPRTTRGDIALQAVEPVARPGRLPSSDDLHGLAALERLVERQQVAIDLGAAA